MDLLAGRLCERLRLLELLDPDPELEDEPDLLEPEELLPELLPESLDELPLEELRRFVFIGERPRDFLALRDGLVLCDRALRQQISSK